MGWTDVAKRDRKRKFSKKNTMATVAGAAPPISSKRMKSKLDIVKSALKLKSLALRDQSKEPVSEAAIRANAEPTEAVIDSQASENFRQQAVSRRGKSHKLPLSAKVDHAQTVASTGTPLAAAKPSKARQSRKLATKAHATMNSGMVKFPTNAPSTKLLFQKLKPAQKSLQRSTGKQAPGVTLKHKLDQKRDQRLKSRITLSSNAPNHLDALFPDRVIEAAKSGFSDALARPKLYEPRDLSIKSAINCDDYLNAHSGRGQSLAVPQSVGLRHVKRMNDQFQFVT